MFSTGQRVRRLQALIEKDSSNQGAHFMLGEEYIREARPMMAAAKFRRVVELNPDHAVAWEMMARCYADGKVYKEAAVAYDTAARMLEIKGSDVRAEEMRKAAADCRNYIIIN